MKSKTLLAALFLVFTAVHLDAQAKNKARSPVEEARLSHVLAEGNYLAYLTDTWMAGGHDWMPERIFNNFKTTRHLEDSYQDLDGDNLSQAPGPAESRAKEQPDVEGARVRAASTSLEAIAAAIVSRKYGSGRGTRKSGRSSGS